MHFSPEGDTSLPVTRQESDSSLGMHQSTLLMYFLVQLKQPVPIGTVANTSETLTLVHDRSYALLFRRDSFSFS